MKLHNIHSQCCVSETTAKGPMLGEGEVAAFSTKRWDRRSSQALIESSTTCHDAPVVGSYCASNALRLTVLAAKSEDYVAPLRQRQDAAMILQH